MKIRSDEPDTAGRHLGKLLEAIRGGAPLGQGNPSIDPYGTTIPLKERLTMPQVGTVIRGTWRLSAVLGRGGFGLVFTARHLGLERDDAIKFLHPHLADDQELRKRFEREAKVMAWLRGDYLVQIHDCGEHEGLPFFAMERLEGQPLDNLLSNRRPLPLSEFYAIAVGILRGLSEVHFHGVLHRDIKPANVFVLKNSGGIKLLDFGLAMTSERMTSPEALMGTPLYMAPELLLANAEASVSTDVYSTGAILYQMLTGHPPFQTMRSDTEDFPARLIQRIINHTPRSPRTDRPEVPEELERLILQAIDPCPGCRPVSAQAFADALSRSRADTHNADINNVHKEPITLVPPSKIPSGRTKSRTRTPIAKEDTVTSTSSRKSRPRSRRAGFAVLAALGTLMSFVGVMVIWSQMTMTPSISGGGILVTRSMWSSAEVTGRYDALCRALLEQDTDRVRCMEISPWSANPVRDSGSALGDGVMSIHVTDEDYTRIVLDDDIRTPLSDLIPPLDQRETELFEHLAPLFVWIVDARDENGSEPLRLDHDLVGFQWATVSTIVRLDHGREEPLAALQKIARCERSRSWVIEDQRLCKIAQFLAATRVMNPQTCQRLKKTALDLKSVTYAPLEFLVNLFNAECLLEEDSQRAATLTLAALENYSTEHSCELRFIVPFVPDLTRGTEEEKELLALLESFDPSMCTADHNANAIATRGTRHRRLGHWNAAAQDFYDAYDTDPHMHIYLIAGTEMELRQLDATGQLESIDSSTRQRLLGKLRLDIFGGSPPDVELPGALAVAYLRWMISKEPTDALEIFRLYKKVPKDARPLPEGVCDEEMASLCRKLDGTQSLEIMKSRKIGPQSHEQLANALGVPNL